MSDLETQGVRICRLKVSNTVEHAMIHLVESYFKYLRDLIS